MGNMPSCNECFDNKKDSKTVNIDNNTSTTNISMYDKLGGEKSIEAVVDVFYKKIITDESISHFFADINLKVLKHHQKLFLTMVLGGPNSYNGKSIKNAHSNLDISNKDFDTVAEHLVNTLKEFHVKEEDIKVIANLVLSLRNNVVTNM